jgi:hypothetical protein
MMTPVLAERADDFEEWLSGTVAPAVRAARPDQDGRWHVLRADQEEDGVVMFAFLFDGGNPDDWALQPVLEGALGVEEARRNLDLMDEMSRGEQYGWPVRAVDLQSGHTP